MSRTMSPGCNISPCESHSDTLTQPVGSAASTAYIKEFSFVFFVGSSEIRALSACSVDVRLPATCHTLEGHTFAQHDEI